MLQNTAVADAQNDNREPNGEEKKVMGDEGAENSVDPLIKPGGEEKIEKGLDSPFVKEKAFAKNGSQNSSADLVKTKQKKKKELFIPERS